MTQAAAFCPHCGASRPEWARFCASCGKGYDAQPAPAPPAPTVQTSMATGLLEIEKLRVKLIPFRIAGVVAGLAVWWFIVEPIAGDAILVTLGALAALPFIGLWLGNIIGLSLLSN